MFERVLIANRGEIAVRIARTCRALGIPTAAVFSDADRGALHVAAADTAVGIGPAPAAESYLSVARIVDAARATGAAAVHPGYGFLSEDPALPAACADAGLTFIGPPADMIARFGSKIAARRAAADAGVPVVPGSEPDDQSADGIAAAARRTGFPLLLKPSAGGGGKGMVTVAAADALAAGIARARREALAATGDGTLYVERRIGRARHVEVQVMADCRGTVLPLGERDCSTQRRHQKVIEETPAPGLSAVLRGRLATAAVAVARRAGYENAGTVEFLIDGTGDDAGFYFLEMNTRLQVEHPITELVTGVDLVEGQLVVATGRPLPWTAAEIAPRGHAIECRICAEDPVRDYLPDAGTIVGWHAPAGPGLRIDSGVDAGSAVPVHYDPLLAKLAALGRNRTEARRRAHAALGDMAVLGVATNIGLLRRVLSHAAFAAGDVHTGFLAEHREALTGTLPDERAAVAAVAAVHVMAERRDRRANRGGAPNPDPHAPADALFAGHETGVWTRDAHGALQSAVGAAVGARRAAGVWTGLAGWRLGGTPPGGGDVPDAGRPTPDDTRSPPALLPLSPTPDGAADGRVRRWSVAASGSAGLTARVRAAGDDADARQRAADTAADVCEHAVRVEIGADEAAPAPKRRLQLERPALAARVLPRGTDTCIVHLGGRATVTVRLAPLDGSWRTMAGGEAFTVTGAGARDDRPDVVQRPGYAPPAAPNAADQGGAALPAGAPEPGAAGAPGPVTGDGRTDHPVAHPPPAAARMPSTGAADADEDALCAPMPATVSAVLVQPGAAVQDGDTLVRLEAMKMEHAIRAPAAGRVAAIHCRPGDLVQPGRPLVRLEPAPEAAGREPPD